MPGFHQLHLGQQPQMVGLWGVSVICNSQKNPCLAPRDLLPEAQGINGVVVPRFRRRRDWRGGVGWIHTEALLPTPERLALNKLSPVVDIYEYVVAANEAWLACSNSSLFWLRC
jgi:hypothetical protein